MGLFDKKYCSVCNGAIGLLGNRKLEDGNLCKDCASKLSPFFSDRRRSTVADIKKQLEYREANERNLAGFLPTLTIGDSMKCYVDQPRRQAVFTRGDYKKSNPDLIPLGSILAVDVTVDEDRDEEFDKNEEGKSVSFNPPKYKYEYTFNVDVKVRHDYFDEIKFELADDIDSPESDEYKAAVESAKKLVYALTGKTWEDTSKHQYYEDNKVAEPEEPTTTEPEKPVLAEGEWFCPQCGAKNSSNFCMTCGEKKPQRAINFCPDCGYKFPEGSNPKFCPQCGKALG